MEILCRFIFNKLKVSITFCLYFSEIPWDKKHFPKKKKKKIFMVQKALYKNYDFFWLFKEKEISHKN